MVKLKLLLIFLLSASTAWAVPDEGSYALYDYKHTSYIVKYRHQQVRSIASITKLFTAITILRSGVDLNERVRVNGRSYGRIPNGTTMTRLDLMRAMLISSDNRAAETLANHHPGGFEKFIRDVNKFAADNALNDTQIVDATGLLAGNVSTVFDLKEFLDILKDEPTIRHISSEKNAVLQVPKGKKTLHINLRNTNPELFVYDNIVTSKTGWTRAAGRCVVMLVERGRDTYAVVVLGQGNVVKRSAVVNHLIGEELEKIPTPTFSNILDFILEENDRN